MENLAHSRCRDVFQGHWKRRHSVDPCHGTKVNATEVCKSIAIESLSLMSWLQLVLSKSFHVPKNSSLPWHQLNASNVWQLVFQSLFPVWFSIVPCWLLHLSHPWAHIVSTLYILHYTLFTLYIIHITFYIIFIQGQVPELLTFKCDLSILSHYSNIHILGIAAWKMKTSVLYIINSITY